MKPGARGWAAAAGVLALAALLAFFAGPDRTAIDWQPALARSEPWRAISSVAVHYSAQHLVANLAGAALVAALGLVADVPGRIAWAWIAAWPLTQLGLLQRPELAHYGGLSGVLHAGVAAAALHLLDVGPRARRIIAVGLLAGLTLKVLLEAPWGPAIVHPQGWDIAVAPFAHASGTLAGVLTALVVVAATRIASRSAP